MYFLPVDLREMARGQISGHTNSAHVIGRLVLLTDYQYAPLWFRFVRNVPLSLLGFSCHHLTRHISAEVGETILQTTLRNTTYLTLYLKIQCIFRRC